ncbi:hypothetical protein MGG_13874 [Pyricularia oryzae 70-15]|uniref:Uncharacterized protein n=1 Tax=Pyricularia oryzae (strain 70-15 / ATCC MYA-4617 / FGSC 8958) TaxID=242507 RepID=G4N1I6_PYRO7|nr:uncharacterized protein MGG_13874 [Pyricularia oryzae 70-15]EHA53253.1 hypothetical protein MGG_13874 [Pyricularia oryzae 70-15]
MQRSQTCSSSSQAGRGTKHRQTTKPIQQLTDFCFQNHNPQPENDCNYKPKRVVHLTDKGAAYFIDKAFKLLRPRLVPYNYKDGHEEVLIPLRKGIGAPVVPMQRKLVRRGMDRSGLPLDGDPPEVLDEIVVGGTKVNQGADSNADRDNRSKTGQKDDENDNQAMVQAAESAANTDAPEVDKIMVAGNKTDKGDGDDDSHTEVESQTSAAEVQSPFEDVTMAGLPGAELESRVPNEPLLEKNNTIATSMADQNMSSDDDQLTEVKPGTPVQKVHVTHVKSHIEDKTEANLQTVADDEDEDSLADTVIGTTFVAEGPIPEATVATTPIVDKTLGHTAAADTDITKGYEVVMEDSTVESDIASLHAMADLEGSITKAFILEMPAAGTATEKAYVAETPMADLRNDFATSQAASVVATPPFPAPALPSVINPAPQPTMPAAFPLRNYQSPLPQSRHPRSTLPTRPTRSFRHSLPSLPYQLPRPPRPPPPLFYETAPRLPLPPPPPASPPHPAPTATTEASLTPPREYDDITGYEHGDTPETYYLPFAGDPDRTRVYLLRRAENIKRANREARPAWRD